MPLTIDDKGQQLIVEFAETATAGIVQLVAVRAGQFRHHFRHTMIPGYGQCAMYGMCPRLGQHQAGQGGAGSGSQPPGVVVSPAKRRDLCARLLHDQGAALCTGQPATAFGDAVPARVACLPGFPETGLVACAVAAIAQPVQLHAQRLQVTHGWRVLSVAA
ncbi:hypothetical protein D3C76_1394100 [compost metagenome]